jgi:catechol 1,2-dioxygenase
MNSSISAIPPNLPTTPDSLLPLVVEVMSRTPDARLRQLVVSLTEHLHAFVRENQLTEAEFERAVKFMVDIGQATGETKNEVILAADLLGVSALVTMINNQHPQRSGETQSALLGPFWRLNAPSYEHGANIALANEADPKMEVRGRVFDVQGQPLAGALVDVWQADPKGMYENQDEAQPDMNLRGRFITDAQGGYFFRTVKPAGYPVPTDGPCGDLLRAQLRQPYRPAHLHFMVSQPGFKVLVTQVFPSGTPFLDCDPTFGVTEALIGNFQEVQRDGETLTTLTQDFHLIPGETIYPHPPIP